MPAWTLRFESGPLLGLLHGCWRGGRKSPAERSATAGRALSVRRAEAMRGLFPKLAAWYARQSHLAEMGAVDRYLSQASDLPDLERRIRDIERRGGGSRWFQ